MKRMRHWNSFFFVAFLGVGVVLGATLQVVADERPSGLQRGDRIVFLGDSITAGGVREGGYVTLIGQGIARHHADLEIEIIGAGISGNKVPDLQKRLQSDVLDKKPTLVVIYIGINDVWHWNRDAGTTKEDYEAGLRDIIGRCRQAGARVVLCTPSVIGERTDGSNPFDEMLDQYAAISRRVAAELSCPLVDLRKRFLEHLKQHNPDNAERGVLTTDGVHLTAAGNRLVADSIVAVVCGQDHTAQRVMRHVVLFKFKEGTTPEQVRSIEQAFAGLPAKIDTIIDFEWGTDVSIEGKSKGFTHGFLVTFRDEAGRAVYLPHPAHEAFVKLVVPHIEDVLVFDYWTHRKD
jgi:lysophospholipase L1-like esterase